MQTKIVAHSYLREVRLSSGTAALISPAPLLRKHRKKSLKEYLYIKSEAVVRYILRVECDDLFKISDI